MLARNRRRPPFLALDLLVALFRPLNPHQSAFIIRFSNIFSLQLYSELNLLLLNFRSISIDSFKKVLFFMAVFPAYKFLLPLTILLLAYSCKEEKSSDEVPNIIVVLADDLGIGDISAYAPENKIKTPNIDRLAREGMLFTDAHSPSSVCTPTRYGLLTGRYNWRSKLKSGVLTGKSKALIPSTRSTVASMLKSQGYETAFIGKWHLGWDWAMLTDDDSGEGWDAKDFKNIDFTKPVTNTPNDLGFDYAYGHSGSLDMAPYVYVENGSPTAVPDTVTVDTGKYSWWREGPTAPDFIHDEVTPNFFDKGIKYIAEKSDGDKPFFLYLPLPSPHTPILPTEKYKGKSGLSDYGDFMIMIDDYMGRLLDKVDEKGIAENTLIIFTSDNGCSPAAGIKEMQELGHFPSSIYRGHKADIFEGGHRIPFLVRWPKEVEAGSKTSQTVCLTDLMATFSKINGYQLQDDEGEDSYDILPILKGEVKQPIREATVHHSINGSFAIRQGQWKLIMCPGSGGWSPPIPAEAKASKELPDLQLYDLSNDPGETSNLVDSELKKVDELRNLLISYIKNGRSTPGEPQQNDQTSKEWKQIDFAEI